MSWDVWVINSKEKIPLELSELSLKQPKEPEVKRFSTRLNDNIKESLGELSDSGAFDPVHGHNISSLDSIHKDYYFKHHEFKLLSYAIGDIFKNNQKDHIFIILDKKSTVISEKGFVYCRNFKIEEVDLRPFCIAPSICI